MKSANLAVASLALLSLSGCKPTFKQEGSLRLNEVPFDVKSCQVLAHTTGIELSDSSGTRIELYLPPQRLNAWESIQGAPVIIIEFPDKSKVELSGCGSLTMAGEGYHEPRGRAASGRLSLACKGQASIDGTLSFSGCF